MSALTPYQPTGPFPQVMLDLPTGATSLVHPESTGTRITIAGTVRDGAGQPYFDCLIELWQADAGGRYHHPADPGSSLADPAFWGYGRVATNKEGRFRVDTIKPGPVRGDGLLHAPHIAVSIFGGGIPYRYRTRLYFDDEPGNLTDPILALVPESRRHTLIATSAGDNRYEVRLVLQGSDETVFFDL